jgi:hypothetical protein
MALQIGRIVALACEAKEGPSVCGRGAVKRFSGLRSGRRMLEEATLKVCGEQVCGLLGRRISCWPDRGLQVTTNL